MESSGRPSSCHVETVNESSDSQEQSLSVNSSSSLSFLQLSELRRANRIKPQRWSAVRVLGLVSLDLILSAIFFIKYKYYGSAKIPSVSIWILVASLIRAVLTIGGSAISIIVGSPTSQLVAHEMEQQRIQNKLRQNDIVNVMHSTDQGGEKTSEGRQTTKTTGSWSWWFPHYQTKKSSSSVVVSPSHDLVRPLLQSEESPLFSCGSLNGRDSKIEDGSRFLPSQFCHTDVSSDGSTIHQTQESESSNRLETTCPHKGTSISTQTHNGNITFISVPFPHTSASSNYPLISEEPMLEPSGILGSEAALRLDAETRYRRAVQRVEKNAHFRRNLVLLGVFLGTTFSNLTCCILFVKESSEMDRVFGHRTFFFLPLHGWLITGIIVAASAQFCSVQQLVDRATADSGVYLKMVHPHKLHYRSNMAGHSCDNCSRRFAKPDSEGYTCRVCDFDCCLRCFKLRSLDRGEGCLRSDRGPKVMPDFSTWMYLRRAFQLSFPFLHWLLFVFSLLIATQVVGLVLPTYQGKILDNVFNQNLTSFKNDIMIYALGSLLTAILTTMSSMCVQVVQKNLEYGLRVKLFQSVLSQDIAFFDGIMIGQISSRLQNDTQELVSPCHTFLNTGLSNIIMLIGASYMCLTTSWELTVLALCSIGPIAIVTNSYARWSRPLWGVVWQALGDSNSVALQAIMNIRTVRSYATEEVELHKYQGALNTMLRKGLLNSVVQSIAGFFSNFTELAIGVLILAIGGQMVIDKTGTLTVGKLIAFQLYWNKMDSAYTNLNGISNTLIQTSAAAERVFALMECKPDIEKIPRLQEISSWGREVNRVGTQEDHGSESQKQRPDENESDHMRIKIEGLRFTYQMRPDNEVLKGIDLEIPPGSVCAFVGRSGGGKSTLIHLLQRYYDPIAGRISFGGIDLKNIDLSWYRSQIGVVAQDTQIFNVSIKENICYGCQHPVTLAAVVEAAKKANLHDFIVTLDEGYETRAGERGTQLSGGQKQRVAIARALLRRPRVLLLDEATSSLDTQSEAQVQEALDNLMSDCSGQCTIILVAHRLSTVINADQIFVIDGGVVAEQGAHSLLLNKPSSLYAQLVKRQLHLKDNKISEAL